LPFQRWVTSRPTFDRTAAPPNPAEWWAHFEKS
jgi:hypothetical protein